MKFIKSNEVVAVHWRDVYALSTFHGDDKHLVTTRDQQIVEKPEIIVEYLIS